MKVKVIKNDDCVRVYEVAAGKENIAPKYQSILEKLSKKIDIKGFQKGAVPADVIESKYFNKILSLVAEEISKKVTLKIIEEDKEKKKIASISEIIPVEQYTKDNIKFRFEMYFHPEVPEVNLNKIKLDLPDLIISDDDINKYIVNASRNIEPPVKLEDPNATLRNDNIAVIDFVGRKDGQVQENATSKGYLLDVGSKTFINGFEEKIIGMKVGESRVFLLRFPKDYHFKDFADQDIEFDVKLTEIRIKPKIEITLDLAKKMGFDSLDDMKKDVKNILSYYHLREIRRLSKSILDGEIRKKYGDFPVPDVFLKNEIDRLHKVRSESKNDKIAAMSEKELQKIATQNICITYIYINFREKHSIQVSEESRDEIMKDFASSENKKLEDYKKQVESDENLKQYVDTVAQEWATFDAMVKDVSINKYPVPLEKIRDEIIKIYDKLNK